MKTGSKYNIRHFTIHHIFVFIEIQLYSMSFYDLYCSYKIVFMSLYANHQRRDGSTHEGVKKTHTF